MRDWRASQSQLGSESLYLFPVVGDGLAESFNCVLTAVSRYLKRLNLFEVATRHIF
jgi:hypothetical protein